MTGELDINTQHHYLKAMGIDLWVSRDAEIKPKPSWQSLESAVAGCRRCDLCQTRQQTVFGRGHQQAPLMLIGEAPGAEEDRQGLPFVGRAGQLLDKMIAAVGLSHDRVYIANLLKCRPPSNRDPKPEEMNECQAYLQAQIQLLKPKLILALGRVSAHHLLKVDTPLSRLRGREYRLGERPLWVSYHPAYLLRNPADKARAYEDWLKIADLLKSL